MILMVIKQQKCYGQNHKYTNNVIMLGQGSQNNRLHFDLYK